MKPSRHCTAVFALALLACGTTPASDAVAYVGATVIDGTGRIVANAVIVESGGHIAGIGPRDAVDIPRGATVVAVDGRWIIPGLIDGHAHAGESTVARYLSYGVTAIRHVGGNLDRLTSLSARIAADSVPGPRLYLAGETLTGPPAVWPGQVEIRSPADADSVVARLARAGVSQVKLYTHTTRDQLETVVTRARAFGIPVTAHLGFVDALTAATLGVNALEHLSGVVEATVSDAAPYYAAHARFPEGWMTFLRGWAGLDSGSLERTATALAAAGVVLVPTLVQSETYARPGHGLRRRARPLGGDAGGTRGVEPSRSRQAVRHHAGGRAASGRVATEAGPVPPPVRRAGGPRGGRQRFAEPAAGPRRLAP